MTWKNRFCAYLPWLCLVLVTALVYSPSINGGLIMDDAEHITPSGMQGWDGLFRIWFEVGATPHYYPVLNSVFWIQHRLWGGDPTFYHLANIVQHACAACLIVLIVRQLDLRGGWLAGFGFALHPVHVESVAWISEQKNTLSTLLALAAALSYLKFECDRTLKYYGVASVLFILALLTKTVVAVVAPALLVVIWWRQGQLRGRRDVIPLVPWIVVGAILGLFSAWFERELSHARGDAFDMSLGERALIAGRAIVFYVRTMLWPSDLMFINPRWSVDHRSMNDYLFPLIVVGSGILLIMLSRRARGPLATYWLYIGMLFPVLGFLNINWFNFSFVANHFQHFPSVGLIIPLSNLYSGWVAQLVRNTTLRGAAQFLPVIALGVLAHLHCRDYRSAGVLYARTIELNPACWLAHNNLGTWLLDEKGDLERAAYHFRHAVDLKPDHARAHNNLAVVLAQKGELEAAYSHFQTSLRLQWNVPEVHLHYAEALVAGLSGEDEALKHLEEALRLRPGYTEAARVRAQILADLPGRTSEAVAAYREAIRLDPSSAELANNLAVLLSNAPETRKEAELLFLRAVAAAPDYADARFNLAALLDIQTGRRLEALEHAREGLRHRPNDFKGNLQFAGLLIKLGRYQEAKESLQSAMRLTGESDFDSRELAALLAQIPGQREAAAKVREQKNR